MYPGFLVMLAFIVISQILFYIIFSGFYLTIKRPIKALFGLQNIFLDGSTLFLEVLLVCLFNWCNFVFFLLDVKCSVCLVGCTSLVKSAMRWCYVL